MCIFTFTLISFVLAPPRHVDGEHPRDWVVACAPISSAYFAEQVGYDIITPVLKHQKVRWKANTDIFGSSTLVYMYHVLCSKPKAEKLRALIIADAKQRSYSDELIPMAVVEWHGSGDLVKVTIVGPYSRSLPTRHCP